MKNTTAIITPTWNNEDYTIRCFGSIQRNTQDYKIIWVDNGSSKESRNKVRDFLGNNKIPYELILNKENLGFVKATNQGMKRAMELGVEYLVLQNNDTEVYDGWLGRMIEAVESDEKIGLVGPITSPCDSWQSIDNLKKANSEFKDLPEYEENPKEYSEKINKQYKSQITESKTQIAFFSVLIKKEVVEDLGLLSEEFGVGFGDDDDYCIRAMRDGWKIFLAKDVFVFHNHRTTFKAIYSKNQIDDMLAENKHKYNQKHFGFVENRQDKLLGFDKDKRTLITFISHTADNMGGSEKSLLELIDGLNESDKFYCTVILPGHGLMEEELKRRSVYYEIATYHWWTIKEGGDNKYFIDELTDSLSNVVTILNKINPDIIYSNTSVVNVGALASVAMSIPHIWHIREFGEKDHGLSFQHSFPERSRYIGDNSDFVIFNSTVISKQYLRYINTEKTAVVYNNVSIPGKSSEGKSIFQKKDSLKLIVIGGVQEGKGQKDAILAVDNLLKKGIKSIELLLVGKTVELKYEQELKSVIKNKKLEDFVRFVGYKESIHDVISATDIVLVCSRNEAFGRVAVESMLLKKPVIGTNAGGTAELIVDKLNGLLYEPGSSSDLAEKIKYLMDNSQERKKIEIEGFRFAKKTFSDENYSGKIAEIIINVVKHTRIVTPDIYKKNVLIRRLLNRIKKINEDNFSNNQISKQREVELELIKSSKFWKLRDGYVHLKRGVKFAFLSPVKFIKKHTTTKR